MSDKFFEAVVIGAGHAGIEAAMALAKKGHDTLLITMSLHSIGFMACNPNIGGTAKGHLVKEIDAMGGVMGAVADMATIQTRMLNASGGPAVHSLRNQVDKSKYHGIMKHKLETQPNLTLLEGEVVKILHEDGRVTGVVSALGQVFKTNAIVLCTGVYLSSEIIIGDYVKTSGPAGFQGANELTNSLIEMGLPIRRFKTGTPPRVLKNSLDFSKMEVQTGDADIYPFSEDTDFAVNNSQLCYLTYTNEKTHKIILDNLDRSPLYNGTIKSAGPRYCPSVETKIVRFKDKERHQIFIEPEGEDTDEMYVQGLSTSMPYDIQEQMVHSIKGLENAKIMRYGYAIEYDLLDSLALLPTLNVKGCKGLYAAGQVNGSSGYEEAAAQGLVAGINAALYLEGKEEIVLSRDNAYIGVLIDDLVTKGTEEPYRMMTSRAEYRLRLRQDNADERLTELGYNIGLVTEERHNKFLAKMQKKEELKKQLEKHYSPAQCMAVFEAKGEPLPKGGISGKEILRRNDLDYKDLMEIDAVFSATDAFLLWQIEIEIKYEGYLEKQDKAIKEMRKMETRALNPDIDYDKIESLRVEARQKLNAVKPITLAQASRISGVNPADILALMVWLQKGGKNEN
ncbi:MAG TPA: tRNA uridine-5-carboxymethylaminomethyl(34) synthesis enzyme MnmG [Clostridia bacterium]|nr:tRNA uridine-5-carboxymethylaminomethyl(34) synthesis enzyme MnmG [Clostridia bacterium]